MSIRPVDMSGMIQRTQDISNIKQQEDDKPFVAQHNIAVQEERHEEQLPHQVQETGQKENDEHRYDAREKGSNRYENNRRKKGQKKKQEEQGEEDKVVLRRYGSSFDIKI